MQRTPNSTQQQIRQISPAISQIRQQVNTAMKAPNQMHTQNPNQQHQVRLQHQQGRQNLTRTTPQQQFRPLQHNVAIRQNDPNQIRQNLRPSQSPHQRLNQMMRTPGLAAPRAQTLAASHQQQHPLQKFSNQGNSINNTEMVNNIIPYYLYICFNFELLQFFYN